MIQILVYTLELVGQLISTWFGSTTPMPSHLLLCVLLILSDSYVHCSLCIVSTTNKLLKYYTQLLIHVPVQLPTLFSVGIMCASLGVLIFLISNNIYVRSVNVRSMIHCVLSLVEGASAVISAFLSLEIAKARQH